MVWLPWRITRSSLCQRTARASTAFHVRAAPLQVGGRVGVGDADDVLFDDRAFVEVLGDVVGRGADELDAAFLRLGVRPGTDERRQERVVDVDDRHADLFDEITGEDLHVPWPGR